MFDLGKKQEQRTFTCTYSNANPAIKIVTKALNTVNHLLLATDLFSPLFASPNAS